MTNQQHHLDFEQVLGQLLKQCKLSKWSELAALLDVQPWEISRAKKDEGFFQVKLDVIKKLRNRLSTHLKPEQIEWLWHYESWCNDRIVQKTGESWESYSRRPKGEGQSVGHRYLSTLGQAFNIVTTHPFIDPVRKMPQRLQLLGADGVYEPLYFDLPLDQYQEQAQEMVARQQSVHVREEPSRTTTLSNSTTQEGNFLASLSVFPLPGYYEESLPKHSPPDLSRVLALSGHLAILGDAGSGKTTLLRIVATLLANPDLAKYQQKIEIPNPPPLPVYLPLRDFDLACTGSPENPPHFQRTVPDLLRFLDEWFNASREVPLPASFLADHVHTGQAWLLLDGLDEIPDPNHRLTIRNRILELADGEGCRNGTRLFVTARVAAYRNIPFDERFQVVHIRDLTPQQRTHMIRRLYAALALENDIHRAEDLVERLEDPSFPKDLLRTPVLIWTAVVVDAFEGILPRGRASLYHKYVEILLSKDYERYRGSAEAVNRWAEAGGWSIADRWQLLTFGAFAAHRFLARSTKIARLDEAEALPQETADERVNKWGNWNRSLNLQVLTSDAMLTGYLRDHMYVDPAKARRKAEEFVALMAEHSGLLIEDQWGYRYGDHLTMQEFLAGCYLGGRYNTDDPQGYQRFMASAYQKTWWHNVIKLATGYLFTDKNLASQVPALLSILMQQGTTLEEHLKALILADEALSELTAMIRPPEKPAPQWYDHMINEITSKLRIDLGISASQSSAMQRHEAALVLGQLYGWPVPETKRSRDPRFAHPYALPDFVPVPAGWFTYGMDDPYESCSYSPADRIYVEDFEIAVYPTTNAMFRLFLKDHIDKRLGSWGESYWENTRFNNPAQPVVRVSWYVARSYCQWLSEKTGKTYRLPTETEWEKAARGGIYLDGDESAQKKNPNPARIYTWGDNPDSNLANYIDTGIGSTAAAGCFSDNETPYGCQDMCGNIWEWTSSLYMKYPYAINDGRENVNAHGYRIARGGSYLSKSSIVHCAFRGWFPSSFRDRDIGFRIVSSYP